MDWLTLFGSTNYELPLEIEPGSRLEGGTGCPDAVITAAEVLYPRRFLIQRIDLLAKDDTDRKERIRVYRVAVETEGDDLVELKRIAVPVPDDALVDISKCAGCGGKIPEGAHEIVDGQAYHQRCVEADDGRNSRSSGENIDGVALGVGSVGDSGSDKIRRGPSQKEIGIQEAPISVTKTNGEGSLASISHWVSITRINDDEDLVTLFSAELGASVKPGRWSIGFYPNEIPRQCDVNYIAEKFFKGDGAVTTADLRIWNKLYVQALAEADRTARER